jgi:hypothetical protein
MMAAAANLEKPFQKPEKFVPEKLELLRMIVQSAPVALADCNGKA